MNLEQAQLTRAIRLASLYLAGLFIAYCCVCLCACPSAQLAAAISAEVFVFVISWVLLQTNIQFHLPERFKCLIPSKVKQAYCAVQRIKLGVLLVATVLGTLDFLAFGCAAVGQYQLSEFIYERLPISYWIGLHPAFTLEMLAGALVENGDFASAQPLYDELVRLRIDICGEKSDLAGAIYCDMGDLCVRRGNLHSAEQWYRRSVALGARTGRGYTALATTLRETGRWQESEQFYLKALELRKRLYGAKSRQYADTLRGYIKLQAERRFART